jgi:16S rRNA C1402 (ribose-2'-O) methylase RsmI
MNQIWLENEQHLIFFKSKSKIEIKLTKINFVKIASNLSLHRSLMGSFEQIEITG